MFQNDENESKPESGSPVQGSEANSSEGQENFKRKEFLDQFKDLNPERDTVLVLEDSPPNRNILKSILCPKERFVHRASALC